MEAGIVEMVEKRRKILMEYQHKRRFKLNDSLRGLLWEEESSLKPEDISALAKRIKRKKSADQNDLISLSNGFLQNPKNISTFLMITGAVNILIKELSGAQRLLSAEAICNLAMGDSVCGEKLAKFDGPYLLTMSESEDDLLAQTCLWTLYNLLTSGTQATKILIAQKILPKMINIFQDNSRPENHRISSLHCLTEIFNGDTSYDLISQDESQDVLKIALETNVEDVESTLTLILAVLYQQNFNTSHPKDVIDYCSEKLCSFKEVNVQMLSIRILGNLVPKLENESVDDSSIFCSSKFINTCNDIFRTQSCLELKRELLWLLGNLNNSSVTSRSFSKCIVPDLKIDHSLFIFDDDDDQMDI